MADNKKYYYLKLKDNFFDSDEMILLESMKDGLVYQNILMKLYLRSLKNEGKLMLNERIPYNSTMLASVTRQSVGDVEKAMKIFLELGLIEVMDNGTIYMLDIQNYIGQSSTEADRIRDYRAKIAHEKTLCLNESSTNVVTNVQQNDVQMYDKNTPEIEIEIELEKELELEREKDIVDDKSSKIVPYETILRLYHDLCTSLPKVKVMTDKRRTAIKARWKDARGDIAAFQDVFWNAEQSDFLSGRNGKWTGCNIDWLLKSENFVRVGEGIYNDKRHGSFAEDYIKATQPLIEVEVYNTGCSPFEVGEDDD